MTDWTARNLLAYPHLWKICWARLPSLPTFSPWHNLSHVLKKKKTQQKEGFFVSGEQPSTHMPQWYKSQFVSKEVLLEFRSNSSCQPLSVPLLVKHGRNHQKSCVLSKHQSISPGTGAASQTLLSHLSPGSSQGAGPGHGSPKCVREAPASRDYSGGQVKAGKRVSCSASDALGF